MGNRVKHRNEKLMKSLFHNAHKEEKESDFLSTNQHRLITAPLCVALILWIVINKKTCASVSTLHSLFTPILSHGLSLLLHDANILFKSLFVCLFFV